ncbi:hypothetical protein [Fredinandcohnia quinoae]|uniref:ABC transporter permease n=1 Tax=Fredinandcohnia quinoae TaxID=2918902 RepID=A0AAW5E3V7_9BACI|nr:hypothetical protein [Fredinandcohnia sp. SECRCQ15]MCH1627043.1 hypothetical protein [Fredinandcohnia sp. SECRCQ15]
MQLLKFELYKIFKQKIIYITFILLMIFSTGFTFYHKSDMSDGIYKQWEGTLTEEKIEQAEIENAKIIEKQDALETGQYFSETELIRMGIYETIAMAENAQRNVEQRLIELKKENNYNTDLEKSILSKVDVSYFAYNQGPEKIIDFASIFSILLTGAILLLGLSTIYTQEYSSGVDNYMLSAKKGRRSLMWSKVAASLIYTTSVVAAWELFNIFWNVIQFGNDGWSTAIQYYFKYYFSPYGFNMLEYHLLQLGFHLLAAYSFALLILLVSSLCKNALISLIINGAIFSIPYLIVETLMMPNWIEDVFHFSFIYMMNVEFFFDQFRTINLFGIPILYPILAIVCMVVIASVFVVLTTRVVKNREVTT